MKLTLDCAALTKLMENVDEQVIVDLRTCVLQEFAKKRVKAFVPGEAEKIINTISRQIIDETFSKHFGAIERQWSDTLKVKLLPDVKDRIENEIRISINAQVNEIVKSTIDEYLEKELPKVQEKVEASLQYYTDQAVKEIVRAKVKKAIEKI